MVDFKKLLGKEQLTQILDPIAIFDDLDKVSGKEYLRPAQESVLKEWDTEFRDQRDIIVKLHTGQGKTLIGLLMLQSLINEGKGPAVYLCPNKYLVKQTVDQADSFGIETVQFPDGSTSLPRSFLNSEAILVTNCKKLFNGKSVFGVVGSYRESTNLGSIVMDDAHKCLDIIRESFSIRVKKLNPEGEKNDLYDELWALFEESLKRQAPGTCTDISNGEERYMAVPFWTWYERTKEVLSLLRGHKENELKFVWELLKNKIEYCTCIFSGSKLEISPRLLPLELLPSFSDAQHRIFLSATLTEDAFLIRDLGVEPKSVSNPLSFSGVKYSGERLILIPTLVDPSLNREKIISWLSRFSTGHGGFGVVSIVPSFHHADDWKKVGAKVTDVTELDSSIDELKAKVKQKDAKKVLVLVNEYDGVDLPDSACRILCLDSLPSYSSLSDRYARDMRPGSKVLRRQLAQRVEQGIGRAIRGSSDWCIVVITGNDLTDFLSENTKRAYLSNEAQLQIKIGEELASRLRIEGARLAVIEELINQCLSRDSGWKEYYKQKMAGVETKKSSEEYFKQAVLEREAETLYQQSHHKKAVDVLQALKDSSEPIDKGWFFQLMAIYQYPIDPSKSMELQLKAHTENGRLFRPEKGVSYSKLTPGDTTRVSRIVEFITGHESHNALCIDIRNKLDKITFRSPSELFEEGIDELGTILGFRTQRPEKTYGCGPDNLWHIEGKNYWIIECKNKVSAIKKEISKSEAGQLSTSIAWFNENYEGCSGSPVLIHPAKTLANGAYINEPSWVLQPEALEPLKTNIVNFYNSLKEISLDSPSADLIKKKLTEHHLDTDNFSSKRNLSRVEDRKITR